MFAASSSAPGVLPWVVFGTLGVVGLIGIVAVISPTWFRRLSQGGSRWVDTNKLVQVLDTPINVDRFVVRHSRVFGVLVIAAAGFLAYFFAAHIAGWW